MTRPASNSARRKGTVRGEIYTRNHIEWRAGKAGRVDDVQGGEYIAGDLAIAINTDRRRLALFRPQLFGARPNNGHDLWCQAIREMAGFGVCL